MNPWDTIRTRTADEARRFEHALDDPRTAQQTQLQSILRSNAGCALGRRYGFERINDADDYRARVPVHDYEDLAPLIQATCEHGIQQQMVSSPVVLCERTSGSTAAARLVPYTASMLDAFRRALHPWLHDLHRQWPTVGAGRAYFAISPALRGPTHTGAGLPLGAASDAVYFGPQIAAALGALSVVPAAIADIHSLAAWRYLTLRCLLDADDLSLVSVWSPTFFSSLLDGLPVFGEALVRDVARGTTGAPGGSDAGLCFEPRPRRAREIAVALSGSRPDTQALWPRLALLSCWTHASAARYLGPLTAALPHAHIQGKGLLATEGVVSIPFGDTHPVLALNSGFFEFLDGDGRSRLAHELEVGGSYRVLLTTHGGLYRYTLGDEVLIRGHAGATPTLEFLGRSGVSDLCGEKVTEQQVRAALANTEGFAVLVPGAGESPRYRLVLDTSERDGAAANNLARRLDRRLRGNPHYDLARRRGQLGPILCAPCHRPLESFIRWNTARGMRLGDIKPPVLYRDPDWPQIFEAE